MIDHRVMYRRRAYLEFTYEEIVMAVHVCQFLRWLIRLGT